MKFNLKNRPPAMSPCSEVEKWFDGFEKETREWLDCLADFENHYDAGRKAVLRQVLGDQK